MRSKENNKITRNIIIAFTVQGVSLLISLVSGFFLPRYIDEYQFAYREIYGLYISYAGLLHFGLLDGILLKYSKYDYSEIDKPKLLSQLKIMLMVMGILSFLAIMLSGCFFTDITYRKIVILISIGIITKNFAMYNSYLYQITNQINKYATLIFFQRVSYGVIIVGLLLFKVSSFEWYCLADIFGDIVAIVFAVYLNRDFFFEKTIPFKLAIREWISNVTSGILLLIANISSAFILGSARMIVQWRWDDLTFGKLAFSFSLSSIYITFVNAISVVLFPALKRMDASKLKGIYIDIRQGITSLLFIMMLGYFPLCELIEWFIPRYSTSLFYLSVFLPTIVYLSRVNMLTNNYLKTYRRERIMLYINLFSLGAGTVLYLISAYFIDDIFTVLMSMVLITILNSIISELVVTKIIEVKIVKEYILEIILTFSFIFLTNVFSRWRAFGMYLVFLIIYLIFERKYLYPIVQQIKIRLLK